MALAGSATGLRRSLSFRLFLAVALFGNAPEPIGHCVMNILLVHFYLGSSTTEYNTMTVPAIVAIPTDMTINSSLRVSALI